MPATLKQQQFEPCTCRSASKKENLVIPSHELITVANYWSGQSQTGVYTLAHQKLTAVECLVEKVAEITVHGEMTDLDHVVCYCFSKTMIPSMEVVVLSYNVSCCKLEVGVHFHHDFIE